MSAMYSNCGFMAFPLISAVLGEIGVFYGSAFVGMFNLSLWTQGRALLLGLLSCSVHPVRPLRAVLMAASLGMDSVYGSRIIFMTSILSVFAIPMLALVTSLILL